MLQVKRNASNANVLLELGQFSFKINIETQFFIFFFTFFVKESYNFFKVSKEEVLNQPENSTCNTKNSTKNSTCNRS